MANTVEKKIQMAFFSCIYKIHILAVQKLGMLTHVHSCCSEDCSLREQAGLQF